MPPNIIAIIDDNTQVRESVQRLVESMNFRSELFSSVDELLTFAGLPQVGCIVSDVEMPGVDAGRLIESLTALGHRAPVIFMTAGTSATRRAAQLATGAACILDKPFSPHELADQVAAALSSFARERV